MLTHFMPLVSFYIPWKYQTYGFMKWVKAIRGVAFLLLLCNFSFSQKIIWLPDKIDPHNTNPHSKIKIF